MTINVNIERLILEGLPLPPWQRPLLQAAVETELSRLLMTNALPQGLAAGSAVPTLPTATLQLSSEADPARLGQQIAQAVYAGFGAPME